MRPVRSHVHERSFQISRNDDDLSLISLPHFRESVHLILKLERTFHNRFDIKLAYVIVKSEEISERSIRKQGVKNATFCERSEEHTSELQSLMRISYDVFCLKKTKSK